MQVHDHPRAGCPRRGQRAPAERRVEVVGVHDPRAGAPDGRRDLLGLEAAAQQPGRRAGAAERGGIALEQFGVFSQALAQQPQEVGDGALLAARRAIAVVQDEDHGRGLT